MTIDHFEGCLVGGAVGDALGAPVEFMSLEEIIHRFGPEGIGAFAPAYDKIGAITDDTQMTLFTAEGLILSRTRNAFDLSIDHVASLVYQAYLRWLSTQDRTLADKMVKQHGTCSVVDGILLGFKELHQRRAPGNACLSSLESGVMGTMDNPINDSKGCGGIMRIAPVGLVEPRATVFETACKIAAITHGHPSGYLAAGCMARIINEIRNGKDLTAALAIARKQLGQFTGHGECTRSIDRALDAWEKGPVSFKTVESLGRGWVAEEALSIGVYCALAAGNDFEKGITLAVNHGGDSDSTGAVTGNLLGALLGKTAIPEKYLADLELVHLIEEIAGDLHGLISNKA